MRGLEILKFVALALKLQLWEVFDDLRCWSVTKQDRQDPTGVETIIPSVCFSGLLEAVVLEEDLMPFTKKLWITLLREDFGEDCKLRWFQELPSISQTSLPNIWRFRGIWVRGVSCGFLAREMTTACNKAHKAHEVFRQVKYLLSHLLISFLIHFCFFFLSAETLKVYSASRAMHGHAWPCYAQPVLSNLTGLLHLPVQSHHHWPCCRRLQDAASIAWCMTSACRILDDSNNVYLPV